MFDFENLFILDMANNHQGSLEHGLEIINECAAIAKDKSVRVAMKFQFRDLDTFINHESDALVSNKHVARFQSTRLELEDYVRLVEACRDRGLLTMCTPFDEISVDRIVEMQFDIIKVASCSASDWPLLEKVANCGLPAVVSTGGLDISGVDRVVSFFEHKGMDFALMHCVAIYPTPSNMCNLGNIAYFAKRYPNHSIGWSTHEDPSDLHPISVAYSLGARIFERHVGLATDEIELNAYSSTPRQIEDWIDAFLSTRELIGSYVRQTPSAQELRAINDLQRGVFSAQSIDAGELLSASKVRFAFPKSTSSISSGEWNEKLRAASSVGANQPIEVVAECDDRREAIKLIKESIHQVKGLLNLSGVILPSTFETELSHQDGMLNFDKVGTTMITVVNREYCKKVLIQLPAQRHPLHFHKRKDETFIILHGDLTIIVDGVVSKLSAGDQLTVPPGSWHEFYSDNGCVFEEISTTHYKNDSVYREARINELSSEQRKTRVLNWGRFEVVDQIMSTLH